MKPQMNINELLARHFAGELLTNEEEAELRAFIANNEKEYRQLSRLMTKMTDNSLPLQVDTAAAWKKIESRLHEEKPKVALYRWRSWVAVAASVLLLIGVATLVRYRFADTNKVSFDNYTARNKTVSLPDGSTVTLYPLATLAYREGGSERIARLEGKAFFTVRHKEEPFRVQSHDLQVEVLGTAFLIDATRKGNEKVAVSVGRVRVATNEKEAVLVKGEQIAVSNGDLGRKTKAQTHQSTQKLNFENTPVKEVVRRIEQEMDVRIDIGKGVEANKITTQLLMKEPAAAVKEIALLCNCRYDSISPQHYRIVR